MAFEVATDRETPENTTNSFYTIQRLSNPVLRAGFTETVLDKELLRIMAARASVEDGALDIVRFEIVQAMVRPATPGAGDPYAYLVGTRVQLDGVDIGTVAAASAENELTLTLTTPLPADIIGRTLAVVRKNAFGNEVQRPAKSGRSYERVLDSTDPQQRAYMERMLSVIFINAASAVVQHLGLAATLGDIQQAVVALGTSGDLNMDDIIALQMEEMERVIRRGELRCGTNGDAPRA